MLTRLQFLRTASGLLPLTTHPLLAAKPNADKFHFAVIADSHIIDSFYEGPEGNAEDSASIFKTTERLTRTREAINALEPPPDLVFLVGDYFHDYPSDKLDFYFQNQTRIDHAKALTDKFRMPVHVGFGNHDYAVPKMTREQSHELFRRKLGLQPYYAVSHKGWKFIHLNNFLGTSWQHGHGRYSRGQGTLGEEQLQWLEAELKQAQPTFIFIHYPLSLVAPTEVADFGLHPLLKRHKDTVQRVFSGHWHRWFEFGRSYGPQHMVVAATRYDENAFLIVEADRKRQTHELLNIELVDWNTHYSKLYRGRVTPR